MTGARPVTGATERSGADELDRLRREVERLRERVASLQESRDHQAARAAQLESRLEQAEARVRRIVTHRWWRLGVAIREALLRPWLLPLLPFRLLAILFGRASAAPPPTLTTRRRPARVAATAAWPAEARRARPLRDLRVAALVDDRTAACLAPDCDLLRIRPDRWREDLSERPPDLVLLTGFEGGREVLPDRAPVGPAGGARAAEVAALLDWCRARDVPSVLWTSAELSSFEGLRWAVGRVDRIFVRGEAVASHAAAEPLPAAAQPLLHNPVTLAEPREPSPLYAGGYDHAWPLGRRRSLETLLDAARPFGLAIYDPHASSAEASLLFPERFRDHVRGHVPYPAMGRVHKRHAVAISVPAAADSPASLPRSLFEALACGTPVLGAEGGGSAELFGDAVPTAATVEEARAVLERLLGDEAYRRALARRGLRAVLSGHTYADRLAVIARAVGLQVGVDAERALAALLLVDGPDAHDALERLGAQTRPPAEVVVGATGAAPSDRLLDALRDRTGAEVRVVDLSAREDGADAHRTLAALARAPWVALVDWARLADPSLLEELAGCTRFARADVIGVAGPEDGEGHRYARSVPPLAVLARREVVAERGWPPAATAELVMRDWFREGVRFYRAGPAGEG
jgi:hypothetical protein